MDAMSTSPEPGFVPALTLGWRLRMARESTGMGLREFAAHIGVAPDTLTSAEKDRRKVRPITINAYALATGVDRHWLEHGQMPIGVDGDGPDGGPAGDGSTFQYEKNAQDLRPEHSGTNVTSPLRGSRRAA